MNIKEKIKVMKQASELLSEEADGMWKCRNDILANKWLTTARGCDALRKQFVEEENQLVFQKAVEKGKA